jgi:hypothetical protein
LAGGEPPGVITPAQLERLRRDHGDLRVEVQQHHMITSQWYPNLQHKVIYRGPLIKGDTAKPLLGGDVVRGLVR